MARRKSGKSRSKRGARTQGGGSSRNRRNSGNKGGVGEAGSHKHHWRKTKLNDPLHFGKHGFSRPSNLKEEVSIVNVGELDEYADELLNEGLAEKDGEEIFIDASDLDFDKVLGGGKVTRPLKVKAEEFSDSAGGKLEEAGGSAVTGEN